MAKTYYTADLAVALSYDGKKAPTVTAKGQGETAHQILQLADKHNIPLHHDPELCDVLAQVPASEEIPEKLYLAVAEVIAFAYILAGKFPDHDHDK